MLSDTERFTDSNKEPVSQLLTPIQGYENEPLECLEKVVEPIERLVERIKANAWVAKENSKEPKEGLTQDESASIHLYTMSFSGGSSLYQILNQTLRAENRQDLKPWFKYLKLLLTALYKLPSCSQTVWRGVRGVDLGDQYPRGKKSAWWGISSCTTTVEVLQSTKFLGQTGNRTIFCIQCHNGKSISLHSRYKTENEIVLMPGFYFEVIGNLNPAEGFRIIQLQEIDPPFPLIASPFVKMVPSIIDPNIVPAPINLTAYCDKVGQTYSFINNENTSTISSSNLNNTPADQQFAAPDSDPKLACNGRHCTACGKCRDWCYTGGLQDWQWIRYVRTWDNEATKRWRDGNYYQHFQLRDGAKCNRSLYYTFGSLLVSLSGRRFDGSHLLGHICVCN